MQYKDDKKITKDFVEDIFNWVKYEYTEYGHDGFERKIINNRLSYILADKGVDKRLEKLFLKRLGLKSKVTYETIQSMHKYEDGILRIRILKNDIPYKIFIDDEYNN